MPNAPATPTQDLLRSRTPSIQNPEKTMKIEKRIKKKKTRLLSQQLLLTDFEIEENA
jgi:hypothetical protein